MRFLLTTIFLLTGILSNSFALDQIEYVCHDDFRDYLTPTISSENTIDQGLQYIGLKPEGSLHIKLVQGKGNIKHSVISLNGQRLQLSGFERKPEYQTEILYTLKTTNGSRFEVYNCGGNAKGRTFSDNIGPIMYTTDFQRGVWKTHFCTCKTLGI
jgi:hypothetical protein